MALKDKKITEAGINQNGVISAPDQLKGTAAENKQVFDNLVRAVVAQSVNGLIDELADTGGASEIGMKEIEGLNSRNVQEALAALKALLNQRFETAGVASFNGRAGLVAPQSGDYTPAMVGAAPAGYGWGDTIEAVEPADRNVTHSEYCAMLDAILAKMPAYTAKLITGYTPETYGRGRSLCVLCKYANNSSATLRSVGHSSYTGLFNMWKEGGVWSDVEWINPPMVAGVEYRTTERYNGKPVYAQLFEIDSLPNAKWQDYLFDDTKNQGCNDVVSFSCYTSDRKTIPTMSYGSGVIDLMDAIDIVVQANPNTGIRIIVITAQDRSSVSAKVLVKYTKS